jgi:hypothetical protein
VRPLPRALHAAYTIAYTALTPHLPHLLQSTPPPTPPPTPHLCPLPRALQLRGQVPQRKRRSLHRRVCIEEEGGEAPRAHLERSWGGGCGGGGGSGGDLAAPSGGGGGGFSQCGHSSRGPCKMKECCADGASVPRDTTDGGAPSHTHYTGKEICMGSCATRDTSTDSMSARAHPRAHVRTCHSPPRESTAPAVR